MKRIFDAARSGHVPTILACAFLLVQVALVTRSLMVEERFFSWAPHTTMVRFTMHCMIDGHELTQAQIRARYGFRSGMKWEAHTAANLFAIVERYERRTRPNDRAKVWIDYTVNGGEARQWRLEQGS